MAHASTNYHNKMQIKTNTNKQFRNESAILMTILMFSTVGGASVCPITITPLRADIFWAELNVINLSIIDFNALHAPSVSYTT